jgi:hypothetical protein
MNESDNGFFDHRENSDEDEEGDRLMERLPDEWPCPMSVCFKGNFDLNRWMVTSGWAVAFRRYSLRGRRGCCPTKQDQYLVWKLRHAVGLAVAATNAMVQRS